MSNICLKYIVVFLVFILSIIFLPNPVFATHQCGNGTCSHGETTSNCCSDCGCTGGDSCISNACIAPTATPAPTSAPTNTPVPTPTTAPDQPTSTPAPTTAPGEPTSTPAPASSSSSNSSTSSSSSITYYPSVALAVFSPNPTNKTSLTFSGTASIEQGTIQLAEYTITDGASWIAAQPQDGNFNGKDENFTLTISNLKEGKYTIKSRAKSAAGVLTQEGSYASQTITIVTTPPKVSLDKISPNPTKNQRPTITGKATSSLVKISKVEVSIDGKSWKAAKISGNTFSITLNKLEDGNYPIKARAFDSAGNLGQSDTQTLIIDTIPPIIGGGMQSLGPQILTPDSSGTVKVVAGTSVLLALSMKGGVVQAKVETQDGSFDLQSQPESNLWFGKIEFKKEGEKQLKIVAVDGAENTTERNLNTVLVAGFGKVLDKETQKGVEEAKVSVYFFEPQSKRWILWEGASYGQKNPQKTTSDGRYSFMIPSGRYYIEVLATGYHPIQSEILNLQETTILNYQFPIVSKPKVVFNLPIFGKVILTIPSFVPQTLPTKSIAHPIGKPSVTNSTFSPGTPAPNLVLPNLYNKEVNLSTFKGKKVLLSFISPWSSPSLDQVAILSETATNLPEGLRVIVVSLQESIASTETFIRRGNYKFQVWVDRDGLSAASYKITLLPQHFFIDKEGGIRSVYIGVLSKSEILQRLANLQ